MPITVEEKYGRTLSDDSSESTYIVRGTTDASAARDALKTAAPTARDSMDRQDVEVEEITSSIWLGTVKYGSSGGGGTPGTYSFSFQTRGGTQHITQSLATVGTYGQSPADFGGAIGVTKDGVEGVDITVPVYSFSEQHWFLGVSESYKQTIFNLTGKVNGSAFKGYAAGECLFLGAAGSKNGSNPWEVNFAFAASPNVTGLSVGSITGIAKKGWEYLWVRYQEAEDTSAKMLIHKPISAYVEQVYPYGDFAGLGI